MIMTIIEAISIALDAEFQEKEYSFHMEEIKQDLKEPCFFIMCLNPTIQQFVGKRYFRKNQFVIQYFPEATQDCKKECNEVAERMVCCLERILATTKDTFKGTEMNYEVIDGVLNFFVNYDCFVDKVEQLECMETMESNTEII